MENTIVTTRSPDARLLTVILCVVLTALTVRLTYVSLASLTETPDSSQYRTLAQNIRTSQAFSLNAHPPLRPTIRRPPLYPLFLSLVAGSGNGISGGRARVWQSVLDSLVAALICLILAGQVRLRWVAMAGMMYALHPGAIFYASSILSESLFTFVLTAAVTVLLFGLRRDRLRWASAAGVLLGLAGLCRAIASLFFVVVAVVIWLWRQNLRRPFRMAAVFSVASILTLAPWLIRNTALAGHFVLVTSSGPLNFAIATAPERWDLNDQASIWQNEHYWREDPCGELEVRPHAPPEDARADHICLQEALGNLKKDPRHYLRTRIAQLVHFPLSSFDVATGNSTSFQSALRQRAYVALAMKFGLWSLFSLIPLLAALLGMFAGRAVIENRLCSALWVFTILIHLPGYVEYRYFLPAVPMMLVSAGYGFDWLQSIARKP